MGKREQQQQNKRSYEQVESGDDSMVKQEIANNNNTSANNNNSIKSNPKGKNNNNNNNTSDNMKKQQEQAHVKEEEEFEDAEQDDDQDDEEDVVEEEEEIEEEIEEDEEEEEDEEGDEKPGHKSSAGKSANNSSSQGGQNNSNANQGNFSGSDKRPRLTDELFEMNLRRKKEHVGSALYIPFPKKVTEEEVRAFVGQGPNIFLVGPQKQNAIVRYRTQVECEKQQKELAKKEFEGQILAIEPKTVKIDPANIDVKTLIVQYSNPDLSIMDFAQIFIKAISISLKGGKSKKESQEDLSFGSAIIIFPSHDEAKEAFLATENLNIKGEQLRVVFADYRPGAGSSTRTNSGNFGFRKGGDNNRSSGGGGGNYNRGGNQGGRSGGNFRNRNRNSGGGGGGGGGNRNFGNRNFNQNRGEGGGGYNQGGGRNYSPNKKFRSNVRS